MSGFSAGLSVYNGYSENGKGDGIETFARSGIKNKPLNTYRWN